MGATVGWAVAMAVLVVIRDEWLVENSIRIREQLREGLRDG